MFPAFPSIDIPKEDITTLGAEAVKALKKPYTKEVIDLNFGLYDKDGKFYIGDKPAVIKDNNIIVDGNEYLGTPGLWELILSKDPQKIFNDDDFKNYEDLLRRPNAIYRKNNPNQNHAKGNYQGSKWENLVKPIWEDIKAEKEFREGTKKGKKTKGKGVTVVIPSDPNALLERLDLLLAGQEAGHTGVRNELVSICDELKR